MKNLKKIKGDASFRKFFRKKDKKLSSIIVFSRREKLKNLLIYDSVNKILVKNKILAPILYKENYNKNYLEIEDFGDDTIFRILSKKKKNKMFYFKKIINVLNKIQSIKDRSIKNFRKKTFIIPKYGKEILNKEANLFCDWYVKKEMPKKYRMKFNREFKKIVRKLSLSLKLNNNFFVHRDFHVSNLIINFKNQIGFIDNQDALFGNKAYDLASLIDDVRYKTPNSLKDKVYKYYLNTNKQIDADKFKNDFDILSVLRNLKIIGIFMRLAERDKKRKYLKLIPYAWKMIDNRLSKNKDLNNLKLLLASNFPKFITK